MDQLGEAVRRQLVHVVASDIHSLETSRIPASASSDQQKLWDRINSLAMGMIGHDWSEVFQAQQRRRLLGVVKGVLDYEDIGLDDPHVAQVGTRIMSTNAWRLRLHRSVEGIGDDQIRAILERQASRVGQKATVEAISTFIADAWRADLVAGIQAARDRYQHDSALKQWLDAAEAGNLRPFPTFKDAAFRQVVEHVVEGLPASALAQWEEELRGPCSGWVPALRLSVAFEAALLRRWMNAPVTSERKFPQKHGISRRADVDHIAAYAPYVNVLVTDDQTRGLSQESPVAEVLREHTCLLVSTSNLNEFEAWIGQLLCTQPEPLPD